MRNFKLRKQTLLFSASCLMLCIVPATVTASDAVKGVVSVQQNGRNVTVTVKDAMGEVIGANVLVKGTSIGAITNVDGIAVLQGVPDNAVIQISFVGYVSQEITLQNGQMALDVTLLEDSEMLDEVVVVGYGTQAKKDITGSVAVVSRDAITEQPVATFAEALQGRASGVYINNSGGPSGGSTIRIRGVGSVNGSDPLIIVDGIQGIDINSVNPNDIESMQVLKDASATAIYGAQAANGVIIITTKQGSKEGKVQISYSGYISASTLAHDGFKMLGAWDAMLAEQKSQENQVQFRGKDISTMMHQQFGSIANGDLKMPYAIVPAGMSKEEIIAQYGSVESWEAGFKTNGAESFSRSAYYQILADGGTEAEARRGTDWLDIVKHTGISHNHELSILGGGEKGQYSMSLGYTRREGPIKNAEFERYNLRINTTFNAGKHIVVGQNTNAALMQVQGEQGSQYNDNMFGRSYTIASWVPVYNVGGGFAGSRNGGGRAETTASGVAYAKDNSNRTYTVQNAFFAELKDPWIKGLSIRTQFSTNLIGGWTTGFAHKTVEFNKEGNDYNSYSESSNYDFSWQWTNTATYKTTIADHHDFTVLVGSEALRNGIGRSMSASRHDYQFENDPNTWTLDNGGTEVVNNSGRMSSTTSMFGLFGRLDYSYMGKYLVTATIRRDSSSKFARKNRWGTFPSISVGWRISDEGFLKAAHETWLDDLKLRAGYGTTGNSNIGPYNHAFQFSSATQFLYGIQGENNGATTGFGMTSQGDVNAKWETVKMFNVGYDLTMLNNRLTSSFDFYVKTTSDMLVSANWSGLAGSAQKPNVNIGNMRNVGIDFSIGWRDQIGQVGYNINANASWYKNKVTKLGSSNLYGATSITTVGQPIGMFYGYQLDGLYKSEAEVLSYTNDNGQQVLPYTIASVESLRPVDWVGHYKFKDVNNDGFINSEDRTYIGNPHPKLTGGLNVGLYWKSWDLSTYLYYSIGNDIYRSYQSCTLWGDMSQVYSEERIKNAWHPVDNPNGTLPLWVSGDQSAEATEAHSGYVQDGSYLRMQNLTIGYSLPKKVVNKLGLTRIRLYAQMSNVFTITSYDGLDPEVISSSDLSKGYDYGGYGMPRQYLFGMNIDF